MLSQQCNEITEDYIAKSVTETHLVGCFEKKTEKTKKLNIAAFYFFLLQLRHVYTQ